MNIDYNNIIERAKSEKLSLVMPDLIHFATELNNSEFKKWILLEYNGYFNTNPLLEESTVVPEYRIVPGQFFDIYNRPLIIQDPKLTFVNTIRLRNGITELENYSAENKFFEIMDAGLNKLINDNLNVTVNSFSFHSSSVVGVLDSIRSQLITKLLDLKILSVPLKQVFDESLFHPLVNKVAGKLFEDGYYRNAILDTYISLVEAVKTKSGKYDLDGTSLMQTVFSPKNPILKVSENFDEQQGFMWMFSGAVMAIRNSHAHKMIQPSTKQETIEWLGFASVLLKILDKAELIKVNN